jgi:hypothetical protein
VCTIGKIFMGVVDDALSAEAFSEGESADEFLAS